jgi:probable HAF family extracellular repeat protein
MKVGLNNLGSLRGNSFTTGLNNSGAIVGYDYANGPILLLNEALYEAFIWTAKTGFVNLGNLSLSLGDQTPFNLAHPSVYASAVNNAVQVVGSSNSRAFIWTAGGGMQDLGSLTGNNVTTSNAAAINDASQVVGYAGTTAGSSHAFLWTASGGMQDLGTLTGNASSYSQANAINAAGQVIGTSGAAGNTTHAFLWTSGGGMKDLGVLPGSVGSSADLINATGQIIGLSDTGKTDSNGNEIEVPFLWTAKKGMQALTGLIGRTAWKLQEIDGINDSGVIAGTGINPQGQTHAFVLAPLPAPSITTQPASATINIGATVTFTVIAQGAPPLSYQWQKNGANLTGATKPTLTINNATTASAGNYRVIVSNAAGSIASASARLLVRPATK